MSDLTDLQTTKSQIIARLKEATASPKPSYNVDGQAVSWIAYQHMLLDALERVEKALRREEGDYEIHSFGIP